MEKVKEVSSDVKRKQIQQQITRLEQLEKAQMPDDFFFLPFSTLSQQDQSVKDPRQDSDLGSTSKSLSNPSTESSLALPLTTHTSICGQLYPPSQLRISSIGLRLQLTNPLQNFQIPFEDLASFRSYVNPQSNQPHLLVLRLKQDSDCEYRGFLDSTRKTHQQEKTVLFYDDSFAIVQCKSAAASLQNPILNQLLAHDLTDYKAKKHMVSSLGKRKSRSSSASLSSENSIRHHFEAIEKSIPRKSKKNLNSAPSAPPTVLVSYPFEVDAEGRMDISTADIERLQPDVYLNDTLIDFYFQFTLRHLRDKQRQQVHFFSTHFFTVLYGGVSTIHDKSKLKSPQERYAKVRRWTQSIDLFKKKALFIPINLNLHWSLAVILNPSAFFHYLASTSSNKKEIPENEKGCILFFDSLQCHAKKKIFNIIMEYLILEWQSRDYPPLMIEKLTSSFSLLAPKVPLQSTGSDCGVFILMYAKQVLQLVFTSDFQEESSETSTKVASIVNLLSGKELAHQFHPQLFDPVERILEFRDYLVQVIHALSYYQKNGKSEFLIDKENLDHFSI